MATYYFPSAACTWKSVAGVLPKACGMLSPFSWPPKAMVNCLKGLMKDYRPSSVWDHYHACKRSQDGCHR